MIEAPTILIYGQSGVGKSTEALRAIGRKGFYLLPERGAIAPAYALGLRPLPPHEYVLSPTAPAELCLRVAREKILPLVQSGQVRAVVIDTLSTLADRQLVYSYKTVQRADQYARGHADCGNKIMELVGELQRMEDREGRQTIVVAICHQANASNIEGHFKPMSPKLPGKLHESLPAQFDISLLMQIATNAKGERAPVFRCDWLNRGQITRDRYSVVTDGERADLYSLLKRVYDRIDGKEPEKVESFVPTGVGLDSLNGTPRAPTPATAPGAAGGMMPSF